MRVLSPWQDESTQSSAPHSLLKVLDQVRVWKAELASGRVRTLAEIAVREGVSKARISQKMRLTKLNESAVVYLIQKLSTYKGSKEAFSLRKLQRIALMDAQDHVSAIESLDIGSRRFRKQNNDVQ